MKLITFIKEWMLIIAILTGIIGYFVYVNIPFLDSTHEFVNDAIGIIQPILLFTMLFLTFSRVNLRDLKFQRWHLWILLIQTGVFSLIGCLLVSMPQGGLRIVLEGAMLCMICPTATAGAVITRKLGGNVNGIVTYTILINLANAILIPTLVPFVHPNPELDMWKAALLILGKVFPLLLLPLILAMTIRKIAPTIADKIAELINYSFYLWAVALTLAIAVTTRSIVHADIELSTELWLVVVSFASCVIQFWLGRKIGAYYGDKITAGQSFGQKNTVLAIWMGYTFFTPVTAIVGGFYSIWHNVINSYQLYRHEHKQNTPKLSHAAK